MRGSNRVSWAADLWFVVVEECSGEVLLLVFEIDIEIS